MSRRLRGADKRKRTQTVKAVFVIACVASLFVGMSWLYIIAANANPQLDERTMCPIEEARIASLTVLLVDVTDPMNLPQRQDFINQLHKLADGIPRFGKLVITKVDPVSDQLLRPVIVICNPGTGADANEWSGNPKKLTDLHQNKFRVPLDETFEALSEASGADRSPIFESIQSVNLTEFQRMETPGLPRLLVIASDLLQHTDSISFYKAVPSDQQLVSSAEFDRVRTDLRGIEVELWMLERADNKKTQPRALAELWDFLIESQNGEVRRLYRISG